MGHTPGYRSTEPEMKGAQFDQFFKVFNDTGGALTNGDVVVVEFLKDTTVGTNWPTVKTPATTSVAVLVGVVENSALGKATIADDEWGFVQIRGYCPEVTWITTEPAAIDDYCMATNGVKTASPDTTSGSTALSAKSFGIAKSAKDDNATTKVAVILFGREVTI